MIQVEAYLHFRTGSYPFEMSLMEPTSHATKAILLERGYMERPWLMILHGMREMLCQGELRHPK